MTAPTDSSTAPVAPSAGLRGAAWDHTRLPSDARLTAHLIETEDGKQITGYLFRRGGECTVVCVMHPRELLVAMYVVPEILQGRCAVWIQGTRAPGSDLLLEHETALLDMAAGQRFLRESAAFPRSVLLGVSGGGPLATLYCQQSKRAPKDRLMHSPGGRPTGLERATLPQPNGLILVSCHLGQGELLMNAIDPSVLDENDPLQTDEAISALNPTNGFRRPPAPARYTPEFIERYRAAQRQRVARIDAYARECISRRRHARARTKEQPSRNDLILAAYAPILQVWRTDADPRCFDLSLDPSERAYGSLWGGNPIRSNFGAVGFARVCTPESWLSNWSALASNASMRACAPDVEQPVLVIEYTGDNCVFPAESQAIFDWLGSTDKTRHRIHGDHHGRPVRADAPNGQLEAGAHMRAWLSEKGFSDV